MGIKEIANFFSLGLQPWLLVPEVSEPVNNCLVKLRMLRRWQHPWLMAQFSVSFLCDALPSKTFYKDNDTTLHLYRNFYETVLHVSYTSDQHRL